MTRAEAHHVLIQLAGQMARGASMPDENDWPWPKRTSLTFRRRVRKDCDDAREQCRVWAIAVRTAADAFRWQDTPADAARRAAMTRAETQRIVRAIVAALRRQWRARRGLPTEDRV